MMNLVTLIVSLAISSTWRLSLVDAAHQQYASSLVDSIGGTNNNHRELQDADKRVKVFQEKNRIVVIEAESVDRRRFELDDPSVGGKLIVAESAAWKFEKNITRGHLGTGYVRFSSKNMTNQTTAATPIVTSLTYYINISNPGDYRLSLRSYKDSSNPTTSYCDVQMLNYPGVLGTKVKAYMPGSFNEWGYRTFLEFNSENVDETPTYTFPNRGTYRLVVSGRMGISNFVLDRLVFFDHSVQPAKYATSNNQSQSRFILTKPPVNALPKLTVSPTLPLLSSFAASPQLPKYMFDAGIANETTIYNETGMVLYGKSKIYNFSQDDVIVLPEWKSPYSDISSMFQTYRSGALNFAYEFSNLYPPGTLVNVTLGFAENYEVFCNNTRGRVFNVTVNGKEYVSSLNVFGTVGCNVALLLSKPFQINKSGKIVINFNSVKQNPMIAFIGIDDGQTSTSLQSDGLSDTPSTIPSNVPSDILSVVPSDAPSSILSDAPSDTPSNLSSDLPSDAPSDSISNVPSFVPTFGSTSSDRNIIAGEDNVSNAISSSPSSFASDSPSDAPSDVSSTTPSDSISTVPSSVPSVGSTTSEKGIIVDEDNVSISDQPSNALSDTPSDSPSDRPSAAPRPILGLTLVEAESGVLVAAINDGDVIERSTIGLNTNLTIVAETMDGVETVRFEYDGITQIEGVAPYAMSGKSFNGNKFWPVQYLSTNGLKMVTVDAYDITYTKSIDEVVVTFTIV